MNVEIRRARALALLLDLLIPAAIADAAALLLTFSVAALAPTRGADAVWIWPAAAAGALTAFLLRDSRGGRARRWLALEVRDGEGEAPGASASIRRNLPLLIPGWNVFDAWPILKDGAASRRIDRGPRLVVTPWN